MAPFIHRPGASDRRVSAGWRRLQPALALGLFFAISLAAFGADEAAGKVGASRADHRVGVPFDLQGFIDGQLAAGKKRIVVPPGCYRVSPRNRQHLALRGLKGVQIIADGVEMICTETTRAVTLSHCTNVTVRGLVIDYDPLPFTQGRLTGFSADKKLHEVELFAGYPAAAAARNFKYEIFRPDTRTLRGDDRYPAKVEVVDARHLRIMVPGGRANDPEQVGDLIVVGAEAAPHGSIPHAVECSRCVNVRLERIVLYASNCFGFIESECDGTIYDHCRIDRRPAASDPVPRTDPRLRSLDADAYHSIGAVKGPSYLGCMARFMGDDAINIHGDYDMIMASEGRELRVLAKGGLNLHAGDPVELVSYDGRRLPDARAAAITSAGTVHDDERAFLGRQRLDEALRTAHGALNHAYTITLDRAVDLPVGSVICAANRIGNGFRVKNCEFGFNRSRGILIKASHGEVVGNRLEGCRMSAILVSPEYWWLEAGSSSDVRIIGNTITACQGTAINLEAMGGGGQIAPAGAHRDLVIAGNAITGCPLPAIRVTSTDGLRLEHNCIGSPKSGNSSVHAAGIDPVKLINCANVTPGNR